MRKLLVASQKGGVGKTTSSINVAAAAAATGRVLLLDADPLSNVSTALRLSEHPNRRSLRAAGSPVPGILVTDLLPGLDVLSPYEDGGCSDDDFENLLRLLVMPQVRDGYDCLIVDAPPFLGAKPAQILATCDEFILVMRAEANAYRTLPAYQELVQRSKRGPKPPPMRGILLTLPEGEELDGRWERELRGRLGTRILPDVIPFDPEAARSRDASAILVHTYPDAPAAARYVALVENLCLTAQCVVARSGEAPLLSAAAAFQTSAAPAVSYSFMPEPAIEKTPVPVPAHKTPPPMRRVPPLPRQAEEPNLPTDVGGMMSMPEIPILRLPRRSSYKSAVPVVPTAARKSAPEQPRKPVADKPRSESKKPANNPPPLMWIGAAMVLGFGLRFVHIPPQFVPLVIGAAVTAGTLIVLRLLLSPGEAPAPLSRSRIGSPRRTNEPKKAAVRPEPAKEVNSRLAALTRRPTRD